MKLPPNMLRQWISPAYPFYCVHDWQLVNHEIIGATLGWDFRPTTLMAWRSVCNICGRRKSVQGVFPRDYEKVAHAAYYQNGEAFPRDPITGKQLRIK